MTARKRNHRRSPRRKDAPWARASDKDLLALRFRDLDLTIEGTWLEDALERLHRDLERKGLRFRPHVWLSNEWFSPDGVPGIAIPFYLAHPRLRTLERKQMFEVEGGTLSSCLRILRHEAGHAFDTAYRIRRKASWRALFGRASKKYPSFYTPNPTSRSYVLHLDWWYAQSHPVEDFAETFAVWLQPRAGWRQRYEGWSALRKLRYVDELMSTLARTAPAVRTRRQVDPLSRMDMTLGQHYEARRDHYSVNHSDVFDDQLARVFALGRNGHKRESAASFLKRTGPALRREVAQWTGTHPYAVDQFLGAMVSRARALRLSLTRSERKARLEAAILLTVQVMSYTHGRRYRVAL